VKGGRCDEYEESKRAYPERQQELATDKKRNHKPISNLR